MTRTLFALVVAGSALASPALADVNYYGTSDRTTASQEQNNADARPVSESSRATTNFGNAPAVYGYPATSETNGSARRAVTQAAEPYLGTSWRYQDNANARLR